jgi:hypothetical protein
MPGRVPDASQIPNKNRDNMRLTFIYYQVTLAKELFCVEKNMIMTETVPPIVLYSIFPSKKPNMAAIFCRVDQLGN